MSTPVGSPAWASRARPHEGRVAIVTGAAGGIGLEIALRLGRDGAALVVADADAARLEEATGTLRGIGAEAVALAGDLALEETATALAARAMDAFGRIDILVNNAGGGVILPFLSHTPQTLRQTIDRNLWTALWCCRAVIPLMKERRYGRIVNIGADSVRNGLWDHAAYNAAKGGVHGLTTGLAREFADVGITINTVAPCAVNTPQLAGIAKQYPAMVERFVSVIPMGRAGEMAEVASMVTYLAGAEASFVTGQVISVNGGSTML
ncbi:SDR family oxidoreductase [Pseudoxanthomonas spadix]|uniref:SDR family oxidoreductase n=1 Tax=Pseudoxanthomonas spadix TaxID=415229 RepID=UPI000F00C6E4|nr:SDR family oxidoreductase [Pseudoxanthomonas spadix]MBP3975206.1 SDR family oxidoreductase [Pseudoxanthomonas spadix]RMW98301.1 SDR family oxidoreductase [Pseudoxanthomonas spadix]